MTNRTDPAFPYPAFFRSQVRGPIGTTRSVHDTAVGKYYPMGARLSGSRTLAELPKYGGVGSFGLQGLGTQAHDLQMIGSGLEYGFAPGRVYNLEASRVICNGHGASGAHSDIPHPDRKSTRLNSSHTCASRMPFSD